MNTYQPRPDSNRLTNVTAAFMQLRQATISEEKGEYERIKYLNSLQLKERLQQAEESRQLLLRCGLNQDELDKLEAEEDRLGKAFLKQVRPPLLDRPLALESHLQDRFAQSALFQHAGSAPTLLGADISGPASADGEPTYVWLYDAEKVNDLTSTSEGSGWGCFLKENPDYPDPNAKWWYTWTPPEDGLYSFWVIAAYSGFFIIRANDKWYNCKYAKAHAFVDVNVHQYFWRGRHERTIIDRRGSNIQDTSLVSGSVHFMFNESLNGGDEMKIRVTVTLDTYAQGSGSYAELNFSEGEANFLKAPFVFISKI
jgi:hypothetical protein